MAPAPVTDARAGDWAVSYDAALIEELARMRSERLPNETGGVLLGIIDVSRRSIHVLAALPQPSDSVGSPGGFERGVVALDENVRRAAEATMHQIRYVGEWHSHPRGIPPLPSATDLHQLAWLREEMSNEGLPALMAIAGDGGTFSFILASDVPVAADPSSRVEASL
jgi:integrative and conjugative element protein (TIGR02256 family)